MRTTEEVIQNHLACFARGDLDGVLADYAPDAVFFTPSRTLHGHDEIRGLFKDLIDEFAKPGAEDEIVTQSVDGDAAYLVWKAKTADNVYELATDTVLVREGKIAMQSFAAKIVPRH